MRPTCRRQRCERWLAMRVAGQAGLSEDLCELGPAQATSEREKGEGSANLIQPRSVAPSCSQLSLICPSLSPLAALPRSPSPLSPLPAVLVVVVVSVGE